jgi:hypothetical protein
MALREMHRINLKREQESGAIYKGMIVGRH